MSVIVKNDSIRIEKLSLGPFGTNTYLLICRKTGDSVAEQCDEPKIPSGSSSLPGAECDRRTP